MSAYIISFQKTIAEAKTDIQKNHQSKLSWQTTLKPCAIFINNDRLLADGYSVKYQIDQWKTNTICVLLVFFTIINIRPFYFS